MPPRQQIETEGRHESDRDHADRLLTARFVRGDEGALAEIIKLYWRPVITYTMAYVGSSDAAQDIAQESFARLWRQRHQWIAGRSVRPFLFRVAHNLARNEQRHRRVRAHWAVSEGAEPVRTSPSVAQIYDAHALNDEAGRAIRALPERRRQVFILARFEELSYREIAELMGISVQTVANQMSAALADLRSALEPFMDEAAEREKQPARLQHG
jgi:RNA polymerase sigma-70 factor, ECF subfamily